MPNEQKPYYAAIAVLTGILSATEEGLSMVIGDHQCRVSANPRLKCWLQTDGAKYLNEPQQWRVYPRTNADGSLKSVQLVGLASDEPAIVQIQGRAIESNGQIRVYIHPNDPQRLATVRSFYLTLVGSLGVPSGAFVSIVGIVNNGYLIALSSETLELMPKPARKSHRPFLKTHQKRDPKVPPQANRKRKLAYAVG